MPSIIAEIKKSVSFIFIQNEKGQLTPNGTGFFVGVKNENNPDRSNIDCVTAKQVQKST